MKKRLQSFWKKETVLCCAALAAAVSAFLEPPSGKYLQYIDFRVLGLLFCLMLVVSAMQRIGVFEVLADRIVNRAETMLGVGAALVFLCFFFAMVVTNDVALITFVPFTVQVLKLAKREDKLIHVIVLQTVAANLGSMLTPVGNPQNLYLYTAYEMKMDRFLDVMTPVTALSAGLLALSCYLLLDRKKTARREEWKPGSPRLDDLRQPSDEQCPEDERYLEIKRRPETEEPSGAETATENERKRREWDRGRRGKLYVYTGLFLLCLLTVLRIMPWQALLVTSVMCALLLDRQIFLTVDYGLLATFACFFLFVGNVSAVPWISCRLAEILAGRELLVSAAASQVISNVPAAVLLSGFTDRGESLLLGVNLGGLGTLIASLASLISYKIYGQTEGARTGRYTALFTAVNVSFLAVLLVFTHVFFPGI